MGHTPESLKGMLATQVYFLVATMVFAATFGVIVLAAGRSRSNVYLALFLFSVAANQGAEAIVASISVTAESDLLWRRVATYFAAIDPLLLFAFAGTFPQTNRLMSMRNVGIVAAGCLAVVATAFWLVPWGVQGAFAAPSMIARKVWAAFTTAVYLVVLRHAAKVYWARPTDPARKAFFAAVAIASIPAWVRLFDSQNALMRAIGATPVHPTLWAGVLLLVAALPALWVMAWGRHAQAAPARWATGIALAAGAGALVYVQADVTAGVARLGLWTPDSIFGREAVRLSTPVRWLLFGAIGSVAVIRHDMLGMSLRARRLSARVLVGLVFFISVSSIVVLASSLIRGGQFRLGFPEGTIIGAAFFASQGFRNLMDAAAARFYGVPRPGDHLAEQQAYEAGVRSLARTPGADRRTDLDRLQRELGLDPDRAGHLRRALLNSMQINLRLDPGVTYQDRYRIERVLSRTATGRVVAATDTALDRTVVLKEINLDASSRTTIIEEARITAGLRHPNVVAAHDIIEEPNRIILVLEHVKGHTLADRLAVGQVEDDEALGILDQVLAGLAAAHAQGVVHRDVKPGNILLDAGHVKVMDFGIATRTGKTTARLGRQETIAGTFGYMAPEQAAGKPATPAVDVYAVGVLARELAGERIGAFIEACTHEDPGRRYPDAAAAREALSQAVTRGTS